MNHIIFAVRLRCWCGEGQNIGGLGRARRTGRCGRHGPPGLGRRAVDVARWQADVGQHPLWSVDGVVGRIGKLSQFVAGCVVLLDLIGPDRLRAVGERATSQTQHFRIRVTRARELRPLAKLHLAVRKQVLGEQPFAAGFARTLALVRANGPLPAQPWITDAMIDDLYDEMTLELPSQHTCDRPHAGRLCLHQRRCRRRSSWQPARSR